MPVSYEASELLKTTVSLSYTRYYITDVAGSITETEVDNVPTDGQLVPKPGPLTPEQQAQQNTPKPDQGFDTFSNTAGPNTADVERDPATGAPLQTIDDVLRGRVGDQVSRQLINELGT